MHIFAKQILVYSLKNLRLNQPLVFTHFSCCAFIWKPYFSFAAYALAYNRIQYQFCWMTFSYTNFLIMLHSLRIFWCLNIIIIPLLESHTRLEHILNISILNLDKFKFSWIHKKRLRFLYFLFFEHNYVYFYKKYFSISNL